LILLLPIALRATYTKSLKIDPQPDMQKKIIKVADTLSAYLKYLAEIRTGNKEFEQAAENTKQRLVDYQLPSVIYFMETFVSSNDLSLDSLMKQYRN